MASITLPISVATHTAHFNANQNGINDIVKPLIATAPLHRTQNRPLDKRAFMFQTRRPHWFTETKLVQIPEHGFFHMGTSVELVRAMCEGYYAQYTARNALTTTAIGHPTNSPSALTPTLTPSFSPSPTPAQARSLTLSSMAEKSLIQALSFESALSATTASSSDTLTNDEPAAPTPSDKTGNTHPSSTVHQVNPTVRKDNFAQKEKQSGLPSTADCNSEIAQEQPKQHVLKKKRGIVSKVRRFFFRLVSRS